MMCKFYNIKIENIKNNFELIESQIINIDDIVKNYDLHFSNIKEIDNSIKGILNYNLRSFWIFSQYLSILLNRMLHGIYHQSQF